MLRSGPVVIEMLLKGQRRFLRQLPQYLSKGGVNKKNVADHLVAYLEDLGPTFIKIGQILSSRPDLVPEPYLASLERLQDAVVPFRSRLAIQMIEQNLGRRARDILTHFDPMPIASGAFAQVHKSILPNGEAVAVKVQRPDLRAKVEREILFLSDLASLADRFVTRRRIIPFSSVLENIREGIFRHLDFSIEADNARAFARLFESFDGVRFPAVYRRYSTDKILTMNYLDGVKLSRYYEVDADPKVVTKRGFISLLKMLLIDGLVHADMHPANVLVLHNGNIAYVDLGIVARLTKKMRRKMLRLIFSIAMKKREAVLQTIFSMLGKEEAIPYTVFAEKMRPMVDQYQDADLSEIDVGEILTLFFRHLYQLKLSFPPDYTLSFVSLITVEGAAKRLCPDFKPFDYARDFILSHPELAAEVARMNLR